MDYCEMVALVTGGASGIGFACARVLAEKGCKIAVNDLSAERLEKSQHDLTETCGIPESHIMALRADVTNTQDVDAMFTSIEKRWGGVTTLINNAGISGGSKKLAEIPADQWDKLMTANAKGIYVCTKRALGGMYNKQWGRIVNVASSAGICAKLNSSSHYAASKGAIIAFTRTIAAEAIEQNVVVNCVAPGLIAGTQFSAKTPKELMDLRLAQVPARRAGTPSEVAELCAFLCSKHAGYIVGQTIVMDGGVAL